MTMNDTITFAAVTNWIAINEAKAKRAELIAAGLDKKEVKLAPVCLLEELLGVAGSQRAAHRHR